MKKTILAFIAGAVVGILYAPDKGSNTRRKIASTTGDLADAVKASFGELIDSLQDSFSDAKKNLANAVDETKDKLGYEARKVSPSFGETN